MPTTLSGSENGASGVKESDPTIVTWEIRPTWRWSQLEAAGRSIEVLDLRSIAPLDEELIAVRVRKTNRVPVAHEDSLTMGFGAEVAALIGQNCFEHLDAPVRRIAAEDTFIPTAPNLEALPLPSVAGITQRCGRPTAILTVQLQRLA